MQLIYNQILCENKNRGITPVESLIGDKRRIIEQKLNEKGFQVKGLSVKQIATLFFALVDILFIVKDDSFYLATLSNEKIQDLHGQGRLLPRKDEVNYVKTSNIMLSNNVTVINKYLSQGKFHFIKLVPLEGCEYNSFYCQLSTMNPYPKLDGNEEVYTLSDVNIWYKDIVTKLIRGTCIINKSIICNSYLSGLNTTSTCGVVFAKDTDGNIFSMPIWKINNIEPYSEDDNLNKLLRGVCTYKNAKVTMNRDILEQYYGDDLYTQLESKNVRYRYCLEEILINRASQNVWYYTRKYGIEGQFETVNELRKYLLDNVNTEPNLKNNKICHARQLCPIGSIGEGKKSFYISIKMSDAELISISDYKEIMPKEYTYCAVSNVYGYNSVTVKATSPDTAKSRGKLEFERQFGKNNSDCIALACEGKLLKGKRIYKFSIDTQRALCQNIMYGYVDNYQGYVKYIRELYKGNNIKVFPSDELIQFLYINKLATKYKYGADVVFIDVILGLLDFFEILEDEEVAKEKLHDCWRILSFKQCKREYKKISENFPNLNDYVIEDTPDGKYIKTEFGRYKILRDGIAKTVSLYYRGIELGNKRIDNKV